MLSDEEQLQVSNQIDQVTSKLQVVENHFELLAKSLAQSIIQEHQQEDELAKSLKEIEVCYKKNKEQLEKDLNKMEFKITQIRDTRERISLRHIKSLDIVEKVVHKVMPNSLTESQIQRNIIEQKMSRELDGQSSIEQIRNDLENDDIFCIAYGRGNGPQMMETSEQQNTDGQIKEENQQPDFEWLKTTSEVSNDGGDDNSEEFKEGQLEYLNSAEIKKLKELEEEKERILEQMGENQAEKVVIIYIILLDSWQINCQTWKYRNQRKSSNKIEGQLLKVIDNNFLWDNLVLKLTIFQTQIRKVNPQRIPRSSAKVFKFYNSLDLQENIDEYSKNHQSVNNNLKISVQKNAVIDIPPQDQSPLPTSQPKYLKITRTEQQPAKKQSISFIQKTNIAASNEKQLKPLLLNKKGIILLKKNNIQKQINESVISSDNSSNQKVSSLNNNFDR